MNSGGSRKFRIDNKVLAASSQGIKVKRLAAVIAIIANLLTQYAFAEDISTQPLTRADCVRAGMEWDENANVCTASLIEDSRQPLTRSECAAAHSTWNENANVCEWGAFPVSRSKLGGNASRASLNSRQH